MQIIRETARLADAIGSLRAGGGRIALVPTMGALHAGHLALVAAARRAADRVVVSIFVNPLQFAAGEDFGAYPRSEAADLAALDQAGCDLAWLPTPAEMYPPGFATEIVVGGVGERWEAAARPGHFAGVATVVAKLLVASAPDVALFGEKDFQQLAVIRRLVADLRLPVRIDGHPIVRDPDGLALSSRNAYLSADERRRAAALPKALQEAAAAIENGAAVASALAEARSRLAAAGFDPVDYVALVDPETLDPLDVLDRPARLIAAARIGAARLIDNLPVAMRAPGSKPR